MTEWTIKPEKNPNNCFVDNRKGAKRVGLPVRSQLRRQSSHDSAVEKARGHSQRKCLAGKEVGRKMLVLLKGDIVNLFCVRVVQTESFISPNSCRLKRFV
jgi:hypothetical protein